MSENLIYKVVLFVLLSIPGSVFCQNHWYWIGFTDKDDSPFKIEDPTSYLSKKTIDKRKKFNIPVDTYDIPVNQKYIDSIKNLGFNIMYSLKWFNGVVAETEDTELFNLLNNIGFIREVKLIAAADGYKSFSNKFKTEEEPDTEFQNSFTQIEQVNGFYLHNKGYKGKDKVIGVFDAGFYHVDSLEPFKQLWENGQILGYRDYARSGTDFFEHNWHGMAVLSVMAGDIPGYLTGTAPEAGYWLLRTEVVAYEQYIEEYNWAAAAEFADSIGIDLINSSLGYSLFDAPFTDYSYGDMDGKTAVSSKAAAMAARKGILVIVSAGNEGNDPWQYITAPSDADSVLAAGAIDGSGNYAYFSSIGPSADNRVKPDVMTQGMSVTLVNYDEQIGANNGTSFSAPVLTGMAASLWQAFPDASNIDIIRAIQRSADRYSDPDDFYGYGIPDFEKAYAILAKKLEDDQEDIKIYSDELTGNVKLIVLCDEPENITIEVFDLQGKRHLLKSKVSEAYYNEMEIDLSSLNSGIYFIRVSLPGHVSKTLKTVKITSY